MTAHRHFCTYFDHRYLAPGLALHASLRSVCPAFTLWVLALSEEAERALEAAALDGIRVVPLRNLEAFDAGLHAARGDRSLIEFYFTCSPCLPRYLLAQHGMVEVTYLDSDLYFFASPEALFEEMGDAAVAITPHRFSTQAARTHAQFGRYNVGWLTFRDQGDGPACLDWWRSCCLEWCFDRVEGDRYADQKYLDRFEALFRGVHPLRHPGANVAPWNVDGHRVELRGTTVTSDGEPLVFFHFQGLRRVWGSVYDTNLTGYGAHLTPPLRDHVFAPYLAELRRARGLAARLLPGGEPDRIRRRGQGLARLRFSAGRAVRSARAALAGHLVRDGSSG